MLSTYISYAQQIHCIPKQGKITHKAQIFIKHEYRAHRVMLPWHPLLTLMHKANVSQYIGRTH